MYLDQIYRKKNSETTIVEVDARLWIVIVLTQHWLLTVDFEELEEKGSLKPRLISVSNIELIIKKVLAKIQQTGSSNI